MFWKVNESMWLTLCFFAGKVRSAYREFKSQTRSFLLTGVNVLLHGFKKCDETKQTEGWRRRSQLCVRLRQRVETAVRRSRQESDSLSHTDTLRWGRRRRKQEGVASEQTALLHWAPQMLAGCQSVCHSKLVNPSLFFCRPSRTLSGGWWRGGSSPRRGLGFSFPDNRMHLVVEPIQEAMMKMLPYFVENAVLTQSEINRMWVQFSSEIETKWDFRSSTSLWFWVFVLLFERFETNSLYILVQCRCLAVSCRCR